MRTTNLRYFPRLALALFLGTTILSVGCSGNPKSTIKGTVTYQQNPVGGTVVFVSEAGKEYEGPIGSKGEFTLANPPKGKYQVYIKGNSMVPVVGPGPRVGPDGKPIGPLPGMGETKPQVNPPEKYTDKAKSGLTFEVTGGAQEYPLVLTD